MDIIKELNLEKFSEEEKNKVLAKFTGSLAKRIMVRVCNGLSAEECGELDELGKMGDEAKLNDFLNKKVTDIEKIRREEAEDLIDSIKRFAVAK
jgi:hypothetical protein